MQHVFIKADGGDADAHQAPHRWPASNVRSTSIIKDTQKMEPVFYYHDIPSVMPKYADM